MSRDEQRALAKRFGLKMGKSGKDTAENIAAAVMAEKIKFTAVVQIKTVPDANSTYGNMVYSRKVRNLTGKQDKVIFPIVAESPAPVATPSPVAESDEADKLP
jgi:hypothetical protein